MFAVAVVDVVAVVVDVVVDVVAVVAVAVRVGGDGTRREINFFSVSNPN